MDQYLWMVVVGIIAGFVMAFGIGANDVGKLYLCSWLGRSDSMLIDTFWTTADQIFEKIHSLVKHFTRRFTVDSTC